MTSPTNPPTAVSGLVAKLLHPTRGILRGIFGDDMPKGKGGPDPDSKVIGIKVGELREIDFVLRALTERTPHNG